YKGVEVLLRALKNCQNIPNFKALIVGEIYSNQEAIQKRLSELPENMTQLIDTYVPNEEVGDWFTAADVVVLPYLTATQSGVIPIAYQFNRPVIATNVGGLPEVVDEGSTGWLVNPGDPTGLAKAINSFFTELGKPDCQQGIAQIKQRLSWESYLKQLVEFIQQLPDK
ncbi:glycosyltransferase family 4 protein, partial [Calditrichota bacterium]